MIPAFPGSSPGTLVFKGVQMIINYSFSVFSRVKSGKSYNNFLRLDGNVPAIIYGCNFNKQVYLDQLTVAKLLKSFGDGNKLYECELDGERFFVILKKLMRHPLKSNVLHIDLQKVDLDTYVKVNIPFDFIGLKKSPGILSGGYLVKHMSSIIVRCKVSDMPKSVLVDLSLLTVGSSVFLKDILFEDVLTIPLLYKKNNSKLLVASIVGARVSVVSSDVTV